MQYGLPVFTPELERDVKEGRTVLGGCVISGDDPEWRCTDCGTQVWLSRSGRRDSQRNPEEPEEQPDMILDPEEIDGEPEDGLEY